MGCGPCLFCVNGLPSAIGNHTSPPVTTVTKVSKKEKRAAQPPADWSLIGVRLSENVTPLHRASRLSASDLLIPGKNEAARSESLGKTQNLVRIDRTAFVDLRHTKHNQLFYYVNTFFTFFDFFRVAMPPPQNEQLSVPRSTKKAAQSSNAGKTQNLTLLTGPPVEEIREPPQLRTVVRDLKNTSKSETDQCRQVYLVMNHILSKM